MFDRQVQEMLYKKAKSPADLPWHRDAPDGLLLKAMKARANPGRALDLGCGSGVFSVYMAKQGYSVTGIDLMPRAIEMAQERAVQEGVEVNWVNTDLFAWEDDNQYDIILDSGCLHSLIGGHVQLYKQKLLGWLAPAGDYILGHFGKRNLFDWRPIGPARRTRKQIVELFAPELTELEYEQELMTGIALPIGPTVQGQGFWFKNQ